MLVRGSRDRVAAWVRRGTVPCQVAGDDGWWGVVPAGPSRADDVSAATLPVIATRPVPQWLRPGVGLFVVDGRAVIAVAPRRWREPTRWLAWTPGVGRHPLPGLPVARPEAIVAAAGRDVPGAARAVADLLAEPAGRPHEVVADLADLLGLPFASVCAGEDPSSLPGAELVAPTSRAVRGFVRTVEEERRLERELEEGL